MLAGSIFQLVRGYLTEPKNTLSGFYHKVSFPKPVTYYLKKGIVGNDLFVLLYASLVIQSVIFSLTFGIVFAGTQDKQRE